MVLAIIVLLVPAGLLALRSLATSLLSTKPDVANSQLAGGAAIEPKVASASIDASPFRGTPADAYSEGKAGITLPQVQPQGPWSAEQIRQALERTKDTLIAARLDESVQSRGQTQPYLNEFAESSRPFIANQLKGPRALTYVTHLAPGYTLRAPVRVSGTMKVSMGSANQLVISASYVWVYPLRAPNAERVFERVGSQLTVLRTVEHYEFYPEKGYAKQNRGLRPGDGEQHAFNADCGLIANGMLALPSNRDRVAGAPATPSYDYTVASEKVSSNCARRG